MAGSLTLRHSLLSGLFIGLACSRLLGVPLRSSIALSCFIAFVVWIIYSSFVYPYFLSPLRHVPTVPGCPLWGQTYEKFTTEYGLMERRWHRAHGGIVRYFFPFGSERLTIADDAAIQQIIVTDVYKWTKPPTIQSWMASILGRGVLLVDGDEHKRQRKALSPAFSVIEASIAAPIVSPTMRLTSGPTGIPLV